MRRLSPGVAALSLTMAVLFGAGIPAAGAPAHKPGILSGSWRVTFVCRPSCDQRLKVSTVQATVTLSRVRARIFTGILQEGKDPRKYALVTLYLTAHHGVVARTDSSALHLSFQGGHSFPYRLAGNGVCRSPLGGIFISTIRSTWMEVRGSARSSASDAGYPQLRPTSTPGSPRPTCP